MACMYVLRMLVFERAVWMARERSCAVSFDSFPPLRIAAFPRNACVNDSALRGHAYERTRLDGQGSDIYDHFRTRLKYNQEHADGTRDAIQL